MNKIIKFLLFLLFISIVLFGIWNILLKLSEPILPESYPPQVSYHYIHSKFEEDWQNTLSFGKINHVEIWNPYGLSLKFKVVFEDGKVASGKLMRPFSFWKREYREFVYRDVDRSHKKYSRSAHGDYQALGELGAYYIDRALGWNRKPPTSGRTISNKMLYASDTTWWGFFQRILPEYEIEVCLIAWFDGIAVKPPSTKTLEIMLHNEQGNSLDMRAVLEVGNVMIFDFLVDDHDRIEGHNWLKDAKLEYIFWDSGLAFRHGAHGKRERDRDIFCGHREWVALTSGRSSDGKCERACMFSNKTVSQLREFGLNREQNPGPKLSKLVREQMDKDPLYPIFDYNNYLPSRARFPVIKYKHTDFLEGIDVRLFEFFAYVDECIEQYGEENVLI